MMGGVSAADEVFLPSQIELQFARVSKVDLLTLAVRITVWEGKIGWFAYPGRLNNGLGG